MRNYRFVRNDLEDTYGILKFKDKALARLKQQL